MLHLQSLCCYTEVWYRHHTALPIVTCVEQDTWFNPFVLELNTQCDLQQTTTGRNIKGRIRGHNWPLAVVSICYFDHHTAHCLSIMFGISGFVGLNCSTSDFILGCGLYHRATLAQAVLLLNLCSGGVWFDSQLYPDYSDWWGVHGFT